MSKIQKKIEEEKPKVEGYMDYNRNVFVATSDLGGILSQSYKPEEKDEKEVNDVRELLEKYKPNFN